MPITPFHFGPGLLVKAASPRRVSFLAFAAANVAVDMEPLWHMLHRDPVYHGPVHTLVVATPLGILTGAVVAWSLRWMFPRTIASGSALRHEAGYAAGMLGGALGGGSHPLIDGLMHPDVFPFWPFAATNPLLHLVPRWSVYVGCAVAGVLGALFLVQRWRGPRIPETS